MSLDVILNYVQDNLKKGYGKNQIYDSLIKAGYKSEDIDEVFSSLNLGENSLKDEKEKQGESEDFSNLTKLELREKISNETPTIISIFGFIFLFISIFLIIQNISDWFYYSWGYDALFMGSSKNVQLLGIFLYGIRNLLFVYIGFFGFLRLKKNTLFLYLVFLILTFLIDLMWFLNEKEKFLEDFLYYFIGFDVFYILILVVIFKYRRIFKY